LDVVGTIRSSTFPATGDTALYRDDATGDISLITSDIRLKKNITPLENPLEKISALTGFLYNSIDESDDVKKRLGLSAQDVMAVLPEAAFSFKNDQGEEYYSIHYEKLTALLVEGVKAQQTEIQALKSFLGLAELNSEGGLGPETPAPWLEEKIKQVLAQLGLILENGIARLQEIITGKITTQQLCVDDVCVTRDEFKSLLERPRPEISVGVEPQNPVPSESLAPEPSIAPVETPTVESTPAPAESPIVSPEPSATSNPEPSPAESPTSAPVESAPAPTE
jgi:hypothetical protein